MTSYSRIVSSVLAPLSVALLAAAVPSLSHLYAHDWPQWRGPQRDGVSLEPGLLKEWPAAGPKLVWQIQDAGSGYSTPAVVGDRIYLLGNEGLDNEFVRALAVADGKPVWTTRVGRVGNPDQQPKFPAARSTPTVDGAQLFALGSDGDLVSLETATGKLRWQKSLRTDFGGKPGIWAYSESPLVDGEAVVVSPGGADATMVALNKNTGEVIWKAALPGASQAAYASAVVVEIGGIRQYVQVVEKGLVGLDAKTGRLLWTYDGAVSRFKANIPSPLVHGGVVYTAGAGTGGGLVKLKVVEGVVTTETVAFSPKLPTAIGGSVAVGDYFYGTTGQALVCADFATGSVKWEDRALGTASLLYADGRLYLHGENGEVGLVEPSTEGYRPKGRFTPPNGPKHSNEMEKSWAYPVVAGGRLYLRDHGSLWSYDVKSAN